ncbi:glycosyltransferase family 2 protein [Flavobacterium sp. H4147]|uniref:glycosyltransferase family 2 protein n=1 Tax=Flavobacterium sp. H4147 TaxID=3034149 RepID=UPI0023EB8E81|nr:glycosyltransferase family 2 protein [Flavobacterium sp. H4147]
MLAIIIPFYKLIFFEETLESLASQTDQRFRVYIGDDASPEDPKYLLEKYKQKFDFIYHRFEANFGGNSLVKQWQRCIELTNDEKYLMILGDDDVLSDNVVESFYIHFEAFNQKSNVIRYASKIIKQELNSLSEIYTHPVWEKPTDSYYRKYQWLSRSSLSEYIFTREVYNKFGFNDFPLAWYSDDMAWLEFSDKKPIYTINDAVVFFRLSFNNISGREDNLEEKEKSEFLFYKKFIKNHLSECTLEQKKIFLLELGIAAKQTKQLDFDTCFLIALGLLKNGLFYSFAKFIRRIYRAKFNT